MKIAILNQKGGAGKTTVAVNLAYGLAQAGKRTVLIDLDPEAHATVIYRPQIPRDRTVKEIFEHRTAELSGLIFPAEVHERGMENLSIVPSSIHLAVTAERLIPQHYQGRRLHTQLQKLGHRYDYILLDCPPNLGVITVNTIFTADWVLIPTTYGRYFLDGIADLFATIEEIHEGKQDCWILRNAFDSRTSATNEYIEKQLEHVRSHVLKTLIRKSEAINQAQISGEPVFTYDLKGYGTQDFKAPTQEVMRHG
jgi:chromosome partitioning protein